MNIKVGILSMQRIVNYGSFLQAYALKQLIEELNCQVIFVDFHVEPPVIKKCSMLNTTIIQRLKKGMKTFKSSAPLLHKIAFIKHKQTFAKRYLPLLGISDTMIYTPMVDCLVIGSDEVFNCIQENSNVGYSLELFGKNHRAKKVISYAASFGNTTIDKLKKYNKLDEIGELLIKFDSLSVRDFNSEKIVTKLTGRVPESHLDPVLVYDYMRCCNKIPKISFDEKYLILYAYSERLSDDESNWIKDYSKKKKLKVYTIGGIQKFADSFIDCSPFEVLAYFEKAEEVITDTFHGSIFSIITHRKFTTIVRKSEGNTYGNEEKLTDLLERLNLTSRMTALVQDAERINSQDIDYKSVEEEINRQRCRARTYLKCNLSGGTPYGS